MLTSLFLIGSLGAIFKSLRNIWLAFYAALLLAMTWIINAYSPLVEFSSAAIAATTISHILAINIATFTAYGYDKHAAKRGKWRVSEKNLHIFALIGGTPAAFIARWVFRHKTSKKSFRTSFWLIFGLQILLLLLVYNLYLQ